MTAPAPSIALLAERPASYRAARPALSESDLSILWHGQRFPDGVLVTPQGERLSVVFRGRRGGGPGPDYRDAIIALPDGRLLHGDVEIHVRSSDCSTHGHPGDRAYQGVVLHLVLEDDRPALPAFGAASLRTVALMPWLESRAAELRAWLERPPLWREPCHEAVARRGEEKVAAALRRTGLRRFEEHVYAFRRELEDARPSTVLLAALFEALGYSQNRQPFRALGRALALRAGDACEAGGDGDGVEASLFAWAGLNEGADSYARELAFRAGDQASLGLDWRLWGLRPENHPQRRLAGGVVLYRRLQAGGGVLRALADALVEGRDRLLSLLTVPAEGYWREHLLLGRPGAGAALVGPVRAGEMVVNAVLPFFAAFGGLQGDDDLAAASRALYTTLPPGADYGVTRPVQEALRSSGRKRTRTAVESQGLLYLARNYCSRGRCLECPLAGDL